MVCSRFRKLASRWKYKYALNQWYRVCASDSVSIISDTQIFFSASMCRYVRFKSFAQFLRDWCPTVWSISVLFYNLRSFSYLVTFTFYLPHFDIVNPSFSSPNSVLPLIQSLRLCCRRFYRCSLPISPSSLLHTTISVAVDVTNDTTTITISWYSSTTYLPTFPFSGVFASTRSQNSVTPKTFEST